MGPVTGAIALGRVKGFFSRLLTSKWFWAAVIVIGVGFGVYRYLDRTTEKQVSQAVSAANHSATIAAHEANNAATEAMLPVDEKFDHLHERTIKEYHHVETRIISAPETERVERVPDLIVDTLNELDRLRALRASDNLPDAKNPEG